MGKPKKRLFKITSLYQNLNMKKFEEIAKKALEEAEIRKKNFSSKEIKSKEIGGPKGPEPTRYGDWEKKGIVYDF